jgi:hypothetical protein
VKEKERALGTAQSTQKGIHNWGPEKLAAVQLKDSTELEKGRIEYINMTNPPAAYAVLMQDLKDKKVSNDVADPLFEKIHAANRQVMTDKMSKDLLKNYPGITEDEGERIVRTAAQQEGTNLGDDRFEESAVKAWQATWRGKNFAQSQQDRTDTNLIYAAVQNAKDKGFRTAQDMANDDGNVAAALNRLQVTQPRWLQTFQKQLDNWWKGQDKEKRDAYYDDLYQKSYLDPDGFMNRSLLEKVLSPGQFGTLMRRRQDILEKRQGTNIPKAIRQISSMPEFQGEMRELGILFPPGRSATPDDPAVENYNRFFTDVGEAYEEYTRTNGKPPDQKALKEIAQFTIRRQIIEPASSWRPTWLGGGATYGQAPFQQQMSQEQLDEAKQSLAKSYSALYGREVQPAEIPDMDIQREAWRQQWEQFFEEEKVKEERVKKGG